MHASKVISFTASAIRDIEKGNDAKAIDTLKFLNRECSYQEGVREIEAFVDALIEDDHTMHPNLAAELHRLAETFEPF